MISSVFPIFLEFLSSTSQLSSKSQIHVLNVVCPQCPKRHQYNYHDHHLPRFSIVARNVNILIMIPRSCEDSSGTLYQIPDKQGKQEARLNQAYLRAFHAHPSFVNDARIFRELSMTTSNPSKLSINAILQVLAAKII